MTVYKRSFFTHTQCGASITEVLLAMAIVAVAAPFVYNQIALTNQTVHDIANAKKLYSPMKLKAKYKEYFEMFIRNKKTANKKGIEGVTIYESIIYNFIINIYYISNAQKLLTFLQIPAIL